MNTNLLFELEQNTNTIVLIAFLVLRSGILGRIIETTHVPTSPFSLGISSKPPMIRIQKCHLFVSIRVH